MSRRTEVARITDAPPSRAEELRYRERRYVLMMSIRALCVVLIVVLASIHAPLPWIWVPLTIFGIVVLPWLAVMLANDRARTKDYRLVRRPHFDGKQQRSLTAQREPTDPESRVIDADEEDPAPHPDSHPA